MKKCSSFFLLPMLVFFSFLFPLISLADGKTADKPCQIAPPETAIRSEEAIAIAKETLTSKFDYASTYFDDNQSEIECGFYFIPLRYSVYDCEYLWRIEIRENADQAPYTVEMRADGTVLMYKHPNTLPYYGNEDFLADATPVIPNEQDATADQMISDVKDCLTQLGWDGLTESKTIEVEPHFVYHDRFCLGQEPVWLSSIYQDNELIGQALHGYDGSLIDIVPNGMSFSTTVRKDFYNDVGASFDTRAFFDLSLEQRAAFSQKWIPLVEQCIQNDPYFATRNELLLAATRFVYGIPQEDQLSQKEALRIAKDWGIAMGVMKESYDSRPTELYFDITDPAKPLWKIGVFSPQNIPFEERQESDFFRFRVILNANTGEIVDAFEITKEITTMDFRY